MLIRAHSPQAKQHEEPPSSPAAVHARAAGLPPSFAEFLRLYRAMPAHEQPEYAALRALLASDAHRPLRKKGRRHDSER